MATLYGTLEKLFKDRLRLEESLEAFREEIARHFNHFDDFRYKFSWATLPTATNTNVFMLHLETHSIFARHKDKKCEKSAEQQFQGQLSKFFVALLKKKGEKFLENQKGSLLRRNLWPELFIKTVKKSPTSSLIYVKIYLKRLPPLEKVLTKQDKEFLHKLQVQI